MQHKINQKYKKMERDAWTYVEMIKVKKLFDFKF